MSLLFRMLTRMESLLADRVISPKDRGLSSGFGVLGAALHRMEEEDPVRPRRIKEEEPVQAQPQEKQVQASDEGGPARPLRRVADEKQVSAPLRREEEEEAAQPMRQEDEEALQARRADDEDAAQPQRYEEEEAVQTRREEQEDMAQPRRQEEEEAARPRREEEEDAAQPQWHQEEEAVQARRAEEGEAVQSSRAPAPPEDQPLPELRHERSANLAMAHRAELLAPAAPFMPGADMGQHGAPDTIAPPVAPINVTSERPKVVIDQIDVVIASPSNSVGSTTAQRLSGAAALLASRHLRRV
ncbi:hypothetical protein [Palleronia caenipelagi]|uniref:hypothetical protein n=1 Tax=Palleronia caenipelagi TaxID=2489174 RepID=UPI00163DAAC3|nr:hypothetical protein [Palleronia caenipelagi]